jgi:glycosyltransferase involved in cell wall biosynthesis
VTHGSPAPIRVGFVLHVMQVAGAEMLVADTIRRLGSRLTPVVLCLDGVGELGARLQEEGVPVVALGRRPGLDFRVARQLAREIAGRDLEVIHAHQYTPFFYTALARLVVPHRVHVIFTEHGRHFPDTVSVRRRLVNRWLLARLADDINAVCRFSARSLAEVDGFGDRSIEIIENGIDATRHNEWVDPTGVRSRLGLDARRRYVICVARFHPVKDHVTLLRAFATVAAVRSDVDLLLVGDGPLRPQLQSLVETLGIGHRTRFLGLRADVPELLQAADLFVLTSLSEAASLTLLEAMAAGLPVVVTAVGGNPEIVEEGEQGYLVGREDAGAAAAAMLGLLDDPAQARVMGQSARHRAHERFQLSRTIGQYYGLYSAAAARLRGSSAERAVA